MQKAWLFYTGLSIHKKHIFQKISIYYNEENCIRPGYHGLHLYWF